MKILMPPVVKTVVRVFMLFSIWDCELGKHNMINVRTLRLLRYNKYDMTTYSS